MGKVLYTRNSWLTPINSMVLHGKKQFLSTESKVAGFDLKTTLDSRLLALIVYCFKYLIQENNITLLLEVQKCNTQKIKFHFYSNSSVQKSVPQLIMYS